MLSYEECSCNVGDPKLKKPLVDVGYKQLLALVNRAQTMYIFPTALNPSFKFFLKSRKLK